MRAEVAQPLSQVLRTLSPLAQYLNFMLALWTYIASMTCLLFAASRICGGRFTQFRMETCVVFGIVCALGMGLSWTECAFYAAVLDFMPWIVLVFVMLGSWMSGGGR